MRFDQLFDWPTDEFGHVVLPPSHKLIDSTHQRVGSAAAYGFFVLSDDEPQPAVAEYIALCSNI